MWVGGRLLPIAMFAVLWFGGGATADTAAGATPPTVKLSGPSPYVVHLDYSHGKYSASFNLSIENDGPELPAKDYTLSLLPDRTLTTGKAPSLEPTPTDLKARNVTQVKVKLTLNDNSIRTATVVMAVATGDILPSSQNLTLTRSPRSVNFLVIAALSVVAGVIVLVLLHELMPRKGGQDNIVWTPSTFTFSGSWATSLAAVLAAVVTVFTTTGVLSSLVPGIDTSFFLGVTILYAVVLSSAPLVYSALMKTDSTSGVAYGTRTSYRVAATLATIAVVGQLANVGAVLWLSSLSVILRSAFEILLAVVALVVICYVLTSACQLIALKEPKPSTAQGAATQQEERGGPGGQPAAPAIELAGLPSAFVPPPPGLP